MAASAKLLALAAALLLASATALRAQAPAEPAAPADPSGDAPAAGFRSEPGEDGKPVFTQILRWEEEPDALGYLVTLRDEAGIELLSERVAEAQKEVKLAPGAYEYKIVSYNLLGKPEEETEWLKLKVIRAEPRLASASPKVLYMDSLDGRVSLAGERLVAGAGFTLTGGPEQRSFPGRELQRRGDEEIVVGFPDEAYEPGLYAIAVENPGGLNSVLADALRIKYQRPVDILVSVGYSPLVSLYDSWFSSNWPKAFKPIGLDAALGLYFVKARWGFLGVEGDARFMRLVGGEPAATITSDYLLAGMSALYKYKLTRRLHGLARAGGGLAFSQHSFDYEGTAGPSATSMDSFVSAGAGLQLFTSIKVYGELDADWSCIFLKDHLAGGITPSLRFGYQLF